jgi:hypothetical protein
MQLINRECLKKPKGLKGQVCKIELPKVSRKLSGMTQQKLNQGPDAGDIKNERYFGSFILYS